MWIVRALFPSAKGQQGDLKAHNKSRQSPNGVFGTMGPASDQSSARFFYCAKTSRTDRNEGCENLETKNFGKWSSGDQAVGTFQYENTNRTSENNHPTVKPTELMRYLIRLTCIPGGNILDPFMGSGSTGKAAMLEHRHRHGI